MATVFIGVGSNVSPGPNIEKALSSLAEYCTELQESTCYMSPGIAGAGGMFVNLVVRARTALAPHELVATLKSIERACGRSSTQQTIDLDLLLYDDLNLHDGVVKVPREDIVRFAFVLKPLSELAPHQRHPVLDQSYAELWAQSQLSDETLTPVARDSLA